jgi:hypothetical protein|tara:strand:- start:2989 stop:6303 length:3315 start_codon:yes stop_codon:yes gene_type:complete
MTVSAPRQEKGVIYRQNVGGTAFDFNQALQSKQLEIENRVTQPVETEPIVVDTAPSQVDPAPAQPEVKVDAAPASPVAVPKPKPATEPKPTTPPVVLDSPEPEPVVPEPDPPAEVTPEPPSRYGELADESGNIDYSKISGLNDVLEMAAGFGEDFMSGVGVEQGQNIVQDLDFRRLLAGLPSDEKKQVAEARPYKNAELRDMLAAAAVQGIAIPYDYYSPEPESFDLTTREFVNPDVRNLLIEGVEDNRGWDNLAENSKFWVSPSVAVAAYDKAVKRVQDSKTLITVNRLLQDNSPLDVEAQTRGWSADDSASTQDAFIWGDRAFDDPIPGDRVAQAVSPATNQGAGGWRTTQNSIMKRIQSNALFPSAQYSFEASDKKLLDDEESILWGAQLKYYKVTPKTRNRPFGEGLETNADETDALRREIRKSAGRFAGMTLTEASKAFIELTPEQQANMMFHQGVFQGRQIAPLGSAEEGTEATNAYWTVASRKGALQQVKRNEVETQRSDRKKLAKAVEGMHRAAGHLASFPYQEINRDLPSGIRAFDEKIIPLVMGFPEGTQLGAAGWYRSQVPEDRQAAWNKRIYGELSEADMDALSAGLPEARRRYAERTGNVPDWMLLVQEAPKRARGSATFEKLKSALLSQLELRSTAGLTGERVPLHSAFYDQAAITAAQQALTRAESQRAALNAAVTQAARTGDPEAVNLASALAALDTEIASLQTKANPSKLVTDLAEQAKRAPDGSAGSVIQAMDNTPFVYPENIRTETNPTKKQQLELEYLSDLLAKNLTRQMGVQLQISEQQQILDSSAQKIEAAQDRMRNQKQNFRKALNLPSQPISEQQAIELLGSDFLNANPSIAALVTQSGGLAHDDPQNDAVVQARKKVEDVFIAIEDRNPSIDREKFTALRRYLANSMEHNQNVYLDPFKSFTVRETMEIQERPRLPGDPTTVEVETRTVPFRYTPGDKALQDGDVFLIEPNLTSPQPETSALSVSVQNVPSTSFFNELPESERNLLLSAAREYDKAIQQRGEYWKVFNKALAGAEDKNIQSAQATQRKALKTLFGSRARRAQGGDVSQYSAQSLHGQLAVLNFAYARLLTGTGNQPATD